MFNASRYKNIAIYLSPNLVGYAISIIMMPIMTRLLAPSDYGIVVMSGLFPAFIIGIITCGIVGATQRNYFEFRKDEADLKALLVSSQLFLYVIFLLSIVPVFKFCGLISGVTIGSPSYGLALLVSYISVFFGTIISFYLSVHQASERAREYSFTMIAQSLITSLSSFCYVFFLKLQYMGLLYGSLTASSIILFISAIRFNKRYASGLSIRLLTENIKYGLQIVPKSFTGIINRFFDKFMLNNMLSISAVGVYNIGQNIGVMMFNVMVAIWNSFQPAFYKEIFDGGESASRQIGKMFTVFSYLALLPVIGGILFSQEIIYLLAPPAYYAAVPIIIVVACAFATNVFGIFCGLQLAYTKKAYLSFIITILGTVANVAANIVLIPMFGLVGGAISMFVGYLIMNAILFFVGQSLYRVKYEYGIVAAMNAAVFCSALLVLLIRNHPEWIAMLYMVKALALSCYVTIGWRAGIVNRTNIGKVMLMVRR